MCIDNNFQHAVYVLQGAGTRNGGSREPGHLDRVTALYGFLFGGADVCQGRVRKDDVRHRKPVVHIPFFIAE